MSTRTMDVPMARPITRIATGYASRANSNLSPVLTIRSESCRQQHLAPVQSLKATRWPTRDAVSDSDFPLGATHGTPVDEQKRVENTLWPARMERRTGFERDHQLGKVVISSVWVRRLP
jgi:hypothetical protein